MKRRTLGHALSVVGLLTLAVTSLQVASSGVAHASHACLPGETDVVDIQIVVVIGPTGASTRPVELCADDPIPPTGNVEAGGILKVHVDGSANQVVFGQLAATNLGSASAGFLTAYPCAVGIPRDASGNISRSDLNHVPGQSTVSNRMAVAADANGDICIYTLARADIVVDVNAIAVGNAATREGTFGIDNQRTDTRLTGTPIGAGATLRINVPGAANQVVIGQLTATNLGNNSAGFLSAYPCAAGVTRNVAGEISRSDLNHVPGQSTVSNRLVVAADANGDICIYTLAQADMVVDINTIATGDASTRVGTFGVPNVRYDTRSSEPIGAGRVARFNVPGAAGNVVIGQLTATNLGPRAGGYLTAYPCADRVPRNAQGNISRSDLNHLPGQSTVSNRLVVRADANGDVCVYTLVRADIVFDVNTIAIGDATARTGTYAIANQRTDTRS